MFPDQSEWRIYQHRDNQISTSAFKGLIVFNQHLGGLSGPTPVQVSRKRAESQVTAGGLSSQWCKELKVSSACVINKTPPGMGHSSWHRTSIQNAHGLRHQCSRQKACSKTCWKNETGTSFSQSGSVSDGFNPSRNNKVRRPRISSPWSSANLIFSNKTSKANKEASSTPLLAQHHFTIQDKMPFCSMPQYSISSCRLIWVASVYLAFSGLECEH